MITTYPAHLRAITVALCVAATAATATALAAPTRADQYDFVSTLDNEGVYYSSITDVIDQGKMACRMLRSGAGMPATLDYVAGGGYAPYETAVVVDSAAVNMCPDVLPTVRAVPRQRPHHGCVAQRSPEPEVANVATQSVFSKN